MQEEVEIRAATVVATERICDALQRASGSRPLSIRVDWMLWQQGEERRHSLPAHHRTLTCFY